MELVLDRNRLWDALARLADRLFSLLRFPSGDRAGEKADTEAVAAHLLETWGNSMFRLAYSYLHSRADAEEVVQDTLIRYMRTQPVFQSPEHEKAWCLRVSANVAKNRIRYNRIRQTDELKETLVAEEREDLAFVWDAVRELPEKYREAVHLFYHEGYSTAEIAKILGRNEATVRSQLARAREQLKTILKEGYDFGE
jgi:RNA polymerase sigma-70 factor (ECF subfamily)